MKAKAIRASLMNPSANLMLPSAPRAPRARRILALLLALAIPAPAATPSTSDDHAVRVAMLRYGSDQHTARCFSEGFLDLVRRETTVDVAPTFDSVSISDDDLWDYPFVIFTGEGAFDLPKDQLQRLGDYLRRGGFVLASAGCSNHAWATSFERAVRLALPEAPLSELTLDHPVFRGVFNVSDLSSRRRQPVRMLGIHIQGRLAMLYSPQGLNDTRNVDTAAPGECCCCGGDEVVGAKFINAGALLYSLAP